MNEQPLARKDLVQVFAESERDPASFLIGAESEKFGVHEKTGRPLGYGGDFSVCQVLEHLSSHHDWQPITETDDGPVIGLKRNGASITLEPSAQLELSGAPLSNLHEIWKESENHISEIRPISEELGISWLATGFHPLSKLGELSWVPKQRYPIMRKYLPSKGSGGLDMMQRTATVQGNFDWSSEKDAMKKMRLALKLSPLMQAWFSNAPFQEGRDAGVMSLRGNVWRNMDPSRSGLIRELWNGETSYADYANWALGAGMFLFRRDNEIIHNTGQTFEDFLANGYEGHRATLADWRLHLTTLFPEVRLKNTLEVRSVDEVPPHVAVSVLAVWTGLLYDDDALDEALELTSSWSFEEIESERPTLVRRGLHGTVAGSCGFEQAARVLTIAEGGLLRRNVESSSRDERLYLSPAKAILESRTLLAERSRRIFQESGSLIEATKIDLNGEFFS